MVAARARVHDGALPAMDDLLFPLVAA